MLQYILFYHSSKHFEVRHYALLPIKVPALFPAFLAMRDERLSLLFGYLQGQYLLKIINNNNWSLLIQKIKILILCSRIKIVLNTYKYSKYNKLNILKNSVTLIVV